MAEYELESPMGEEAIRKLRVGDVVYLSGVIYTARDAAHRRALKYAREGKKLPVDFRGHAVYHCGPVMKKVDRGWKVISCGPTTSTRMEAIEAEFIERFGVRMIIGKGGMGSKTSEALKKHGAVYVLFTGGAGALAAERIKRVAGVCLLYTSPSPRDLSTSRMPSSA